MAQTSGRPGRDRDERGRPKSARPRDAFGRPLPREARNEVEEVVASSPEEALALGVEHFNAGRFFQAHEIWEEAWHPAPEPERDFWQGLIQVAVGFTHFQRGNPRGAVTLLERGAARLEAYGEEYRGIPAAEVVRSARANAEAIRRDGPEARIEPPALPS